MTTLLESIAALLARDLAALGREVEAYPDDATIWRPILGMPNIGGALVLHICGNLRHYVGRVLGHTSYVRDRPAEFSARDRPRAELLAVVDSTRREVASALAGLDPTVLGRPFPEAVGGVTPETGDLLVHLVSHLAYHLGQLDYHRRGATGMSDSISPMSLRELASTRA